MLSLIMPMLRPVKARVDEGSPPDKPPNPKKFGTYCIRANVELLDEETNEIDMLIKGYSRNVNITERVTNICKRKMKQNPGTVCSEPEVCFIGDVKNCDGHIMLFKEDNTWLIPPPFNQY